jgi:glyoxylate reductase
MTAPKTAATDPLVVVTRRLHGEFAPVGARVKLHTDRDGLPRAELLRFVAGASAIVTWVSERVNAELLDAAGPTLRGVCNYAVGLDNIDLEECRRRGLTVTNTPDVVTEGTADLAWALILAVARRLNVADRFARSTEYAARGPLGADEMLGLDLTGKTLLIVGAGRIGRAVALRSIGWGMRVLYVARSMHWDFELAPLAAQRVSLAEGLAQADVVSLHTPLTPETRHLIDAQAIARLKRTAILVNTARGPIVDEDALVSALRSNAIWGAGLDVFEREPKVHEGLIEADNCVLSPHIGSAAARYREMMTAIAARNASAVVLGKTPPNKVI